MLEGISILATRIGATFATLGCHLTVGNALDLAFQVIIENYFLTLILTGLEEIHHLQILVGFLDLIALQQHLGKPFLP